MVKKCLTIGIILLLVSIGFAPSLFADVETISEENKLVELTVEFYGLEKPNSYRVSVEREDVDRLDDLFIEFKTKLNETNSIEETIVIYEWAIEELDEIGLLGNLNVEDAKRLVTGGFYYNKFIELFNTYYNTEIELENLNFLCLLAGETSGTFFFGPINSFVARMNVIIMLISAFLSLDNIAGLLALLYLILFLPIAFFGDLTSFFPISIYNTITFGGDYLTPFWCRGWVKTFGLLGVKNWEGGIWGEFFPILSELYTGVIGFTGIHIYDESNIAKYFGFATAVNLDSN